MLVFFFLDLRLKYRAGYLKKQGKDKPGLERNLNSDMRAKKKKVNSVLFFLLTM